MADYFEQAMKVIIQGVLVREIDFSIYPPGGPTAEDIAGKAAAALRADNYAQETGIGSRTEYEQSTL